jgi:hypothetical protein
MDTPQNYLMNTIKHPVLVGAAVVAAVIGGSLLWAQQGKSTPTPVPAKAVAKPAPAAAAPAMAAATPPAATLVAADPWATTERNQKKARESARDAALQALALPPSAFCKLEGRRNLVNTLAGYVEQRTTQQRQYAANWGEAGKGFIASAWGSAADQQVEAKMRTVYAAGYFRLNEVRVSQRQAMSKLLSEVKQVRGNPCMRKA